MDPVSVLFGAGIFAAGFAVRALYGRRLDRRPTGDAGPMCGCGHSLATHDRDTNMCSAEVRRKHYTHRGDRNGWEWMPCACLRYTGPEHIADVWAPGLPPGK